MVRMLLRKEGVVKRLFGHAVRLVLDALPPLVAHDVDLIRERLLIDDVEQIAHPIRFNPQGELQLIRWDGLEVVRAIEVGRAVDVGRARGLEQLEMCVGGDVLRPLEHHVLEEVCKAGPSRCLVGGPDVVPEVDGHHRQPLVLGENHLQPVRQGKCLMLEPRRVRSRRGLGAGLGVGDLHRPQGHHAEPRNEDYHQNRFARTHSCLP